MSGRLPAAEDLARTGATQRNLPDGNGTDLSLRRAEKQLCAALGAAHLAPADNRAFELAAQERGQGQRGCAAAASGAGQSPNPPPGSTSAIAFCSRISTGSFPLHLQDRSTLPRCGSVGTASRSSLLPGSVQEPHRVQTTRVPASSWFVLCQRAERSCKVSNLREFSSCRCCTIVGGTSELAGQSLPTLRGQGQPHGEQPGVWDLRPLPGGRKEEEQRDGTRGREHLQHYWHLGTSGALWVPEVLLRPPGAAPDTSPPRAGQTPEMRDSC